MSVSLDVDRKTLRKYLAPAVAAGMTPGSGRSAREWAALVQEWFPHEAEPGEHAQVDYGLLGRWPDPVTGKWIPSARVIPELLDQPIHNERSKEH